MDTNLRQSYLNLKVSDEQTPVWVKKLSNILRCDIHDKPLGCRISDTHVRIGEVHIDSFYEAQILFSHNYWIKRFANWLTEKIKNEVKNKNSRIVLIGFETYFEPVLYAIYRKLEEDGYNRPKYLIYEEPKYIQAQETSEKKIRYIDEITDKNSSSYIDINEITNSEGTDGYSNVKLIYICGISSTLNTFNQMINEFAHEYIKKFRNNIRNDEMKSKTDLIRGNHKEFSIIQILPEHNNDSENIREKLGLQIIERTSKVKRSFGVTNIVAEYLVSVNCKWQLASSCKWCFPEDYRDERPIIAVSDTSVIPVQMIDEKGYASSQSKSTYSKINFFEKIANGDKKAFLYHKYLYYNHTNRDEHHYLYYIRTGHLLRDIFEKKRDDFIDLCEKIRGKLCLKSNGEQVNVIISPRHFSDEMFPQLINEYVFDNQAHMVSLDIKKEYRSNFETKYSNFSYFLEQIRDIGPSACINFYFVDDQLITGATFYRAKSFVSSLMHKTKVINLNNKINIFAGIIIFVNRLSNNSKYDYIDDPKNKFHSIIDISVPSVRSYGDSCPMCKMEADALRIQKASVLDCTSYHWAEKQYHHRSRTLTQSKKDQEGKDEELLERYFRRFYCENLLWQGIDKSYLKRSNEKIHCLKDCREASDFLEYFLHIIRETLETIKQDQNQYSQIESLPAGDLQIEYLISFVKAISRPFIYYKENAKKATLIILIELANILINLSKNKQQFDLEISNFHKINVKLGRHLQRYDLLVILINSLASINSTYLLNINRINNICSSDIVINDEVKEATKDDDSKKIESIILYAYKRIICGISGREKCAKFIIELEKLFSSENYNKMAQNIKDLFQAMYLESVSEEQLLDSTEYNQKSVIDKYAKIASELQKIERQDKIKLKFYYYDKNLRGDLFEIAQAAELTDFCNIIDKGHKTKGSNEDIKKEIDIKGYKYEENRWIIKMHHYKSDDFISKLPGDQDVYLFFEFDKALGLCSRLQTIKNVLQYRYCITEEIRKDLDAGAIKSAIQAEGARKLLASDKTFGHGQVENLDGLYKMAYYMICSPGDHRQEAYELISLFMDRCIGFGGTRELYYRYFNQNQDIQKPFDPRCTKNLNSIDYVGDYLSFIEQKNFFCKLYRKEAQVSVIGCEKVNGKYIIPDAFKDKLPKLQRVPDEIKENTLQETDIPFQIILIGLLDVLIRNACKHGKVSDTNVICICFERERNEITLTNDLKDEQATNHEDDILLLNEEQFLRDNIVTNGEKDNVHFTTLFFENYLPRLNEDNSIGWRVIGGPNKKNKKYIAQIKLGERRD